MSWTQTKQIGAWLLEQCGIAEPVYLISFDEARQVDPRLVAAGIEGYTSFLCDLIFSGHLHEKGEWQGRGFAAVINYQPDKPLAKMLGTVLHEAAHFLTFPIACSQADDFIRGRVALRLVCEDWKQDAPDPTEKDLPAWYPHGPQFIRAAVHLAHRAGQHIECIRAQHLRFSSLYFPQPMFSEATFLNALQSELSSQEPIRDILAKDPPQSFTRVWEVATCN